MDDLNLERVNSVVLMTQTKGWEYLKEDLENLLEHFRNEYEEISPCAENIHLIAKARSNIKAIKFLFQLVESYRDQLHESRDEKE